MVPSFLLLSFFRLSLRELMYKRTGFEARIVSKPVSYFSKILVVKQAYSL